MKKLTIIVFALFLSTATYAQLDEKGKQFLDSLGIKYDPNDPDAELKLELQVSEHPHQVRTL